MNLEFRHDEAVDQTNTCADEHNEQQHQHDVGRGSACQHAIGNVRTLEQDGRHESGQASHAAAGQVRTGQNDTAGNAQRHRQTGGGQGDDVDEGRA